jgi:hypothetical protein
MLGRSISILLLALAALLLLSVASTPYMTPALAQGAGPPLMAAMPNLNEIATLELRAVLPTERPVIEMSTGQFDLKPNASRYSANLRIKPILRHSAWPLLT